LGDDPGERGCKQRIGCFLIGFIIVSIVLGVLAVKFGIVKEIWHP
jgi:hypothetical protein